VPDAEQTCVSEVALVVLQLIVKLWPATMDVCEGLIVGGGWTDMEVVLFCPKRCWCSHTIPHWKE
jgi:ornithine carbamoyltransferase